MNRTLKIFVFGLLAILLSAQVFATPESDGVVADGIQLEELCNGGCQDDTVGDPAAKAPDEAEPEAASDETSEPADESEESAVESEDSTDDDVGSDDEDADDDSDK